jgi:hypothetical protein
MPPALIDGQGRNRVDPVGAIRKIGVPHRTRLGDDTCYQRVNTVGLLRIRWIPWYRDIEVVGGNRDRSCTRVAIGRGGCIPRVGWGPLLDRENARLMIG